MTKRVAWASWALLGVGAFAAASCTESSPVGDVTTSSSSAGGASGAGGTSVGGGTSTAASMGTAGRSALPPVEKIDLVLGIDNSSSMADKQQILALALGDMIQSLTNPPCVDANGSPVEAGPGGACPAGSAHEFEPIRDIHIGVVTSSIGSHGADACPTTPTVVAPDGNPTMNDAGHLVTRGPNGTTVQTYLGQGYLAWDPDAKLNPPGESNVLKLTTAINDLVLGAGEEGCGYESQLESWYRFLVDPSPYESIVRKGDVFVREGTDAKLLHERAQFLRPDSLLAIVMLSDENDCSTQEDSFYPWVNQIDDPTGGGSFHLPRPRAVCATDPNDACCAPCVPTKPNSAPPGCKADPTCATNGGFLTELEDDSNLRCWDQKRRFGMDFNYPVDRYITALTSPQIPDRSGNMVDNPIYAAPAGTTARDPGLVLLAGIVGLPWQDVARDPNDPSQGVKSYEELQQSTNGKNSWDLLIGDPPKYVAPLTPFMLESDAPRSGTDPVTGIQTSPPGSGLANAINGSEYTVSQKDDLEYACVVKLPSARDCSDGSLTGGCDCRDTNNDKPICANNPNGTGNTLQVAAKAYPGIRQLSVLQGIGPQSVVSSICPSNLTNQSAVDFAYRPAVQALIERVKTRLKPAK